MHSGVQVQVKPNIPYAITPGSIYRRSPVRHRSEFDLNLYTQVPKAGILGIVIIVCDVNPVSARRDDRRDQLLALLLRRRLEQPPVWVPDQILAAVGEPAVSYRRLHLSVKSGAYSTNDSGLEPAEPTNDPGAGFDTLHQAPVT